MYSTAAGGSVFGKNGPDCIVDGEKGDDTIWDGISSYSMLVANLRDRFEQPFFCYPEPFLTDDFRRSVLLTDPKAHNNCPSTLGAHLDAARYRTQWYRMGIDSRLILPAGPTACQTE